MIGSLIFVISICLLFRSSAGDKDKPIFTKKAETARWLAHQNIWGTISTTSVHMNGTAWGQPKSFVDGSIDNSTGVLYFYDTDMDTSIQDVNANPNVAFSISMAAQGLCPPDSIDPEDPRCARVVMSGVLEVVTDADEVAFAKSALFERHPTMESWPEDHNWKTHKISKFTEIWLIDIFGGASMITPADYFAVKM